MANLKAPSTQPPNERLAATGVKASESSTAHGVCEATATNRRTVSFLTIQLFVLIYFQKIGIPVSSTTQISVPMAFFFAMAAPALVRNTLFIEPMRLFLFWILSIVALASQLGVAHYSFSSLMLFVVLSFALTFSWTLTPDDYAKVCKSFSKMMILPALFVFVQYVYEIRHGVGSSLSLEPFIPKPLLMTGYIYETSSDVWVTWNRPNGLVFLEPSFCSAFLACAFINEVHILRRYGRAALFFAALLATNGGTGWLMTGIALLVIGLLRRPATTIAVAILALIAIEAAGVISFDLPLISRLTELSDTRTSGYARLIAPLQALITLAPNPDFFFSGYGAAQVPADYGSPWPVARLIYEYGLLTTLTYLIFIFSCFWGGSNLPLRVGVFVVFQFTGGYLLSPFMILFIFLICMGKVSPSAARSGLRLKDIEIPANQDRERELVSLSKRGATI